MKNHPILFSGPMVRALLDGTKTQARRLMPGVDTSRNFSGMNDKGEIWVGFLGWIPPAYALANIGRCSRDCMPKYRAGDQLWVRETCRAVEHESGEDAVEYIADGSCIRINNNLDAADRWGAMYHYGKVGPNDERREGAQVPSIHMPRWASRLTLTVTDVRIQRLQDIGPSDAVAEGIKEVSGEWPNATKPAYQAYGQDACYAGPSSSRLSFMTLWDSLNAARAPWSLNPAVAVYTFTVTKQNIDRMTP